MPLRGICLWGRMNRSMLSTRGMLGLATASMFLLLLHLHDHSSAEEAGPMRVPCLPSYVSAHCPEPSIGCF